MKASSILFRTFIVAFASVLFAGSAHEVDAQSWPNKPVKIVVPFAPGGATDIIGRLVAQKLSDRLGQPVIVENKPGAGTTIGNAAVAKAAADGYTLLFAPTPFVITQALYPSLPYDPAKDFAPVALLAVSPFILVVNVRAARKERRRARRAGQSQAGRAHVLLGGQRVGAAPCRRALQVQR